MTYLESRRPGPKGPEFLILARVHRFSLLFRCFLLNDSSTTDHHKNLAFTSQMIHARGETRRLQDTLFQSHLRNELEYHNN